MQYSLNIEWPIENIPEGITIKKRFWQEKHETIFDVKNRALVLPSKEEVASQILYQMLFPFLNHFKIYLNGKFFRFPIHCFMF